MAIATTTEVTHKCGHAQQHDLSDIPAVRHQLAPAEEDQVRQQLPLLAGSEKQSAWGTRVRFELLRDSYRDLVEEGALSEAAFDEQIVAPARQVTRAGWWIDNRNTAVSDLAELLADPGEEAAPNENPY